MDNWGARTLRIHGPLNPGVGSTRAVRASMEGCQLNVRARAMAAGK
jgi:hypothetical protein